MKILFWVVVLVLILSIGVIIWAVVIEKGSHKEYQQNSAQVRILLEASPELKKLSRQNMKISEFIKKNSWQITEQDIDFVKQHPDFMEYLTKNPKLVDMVINDPDPRKITSEIFAEFSKRQ